MRGTLPSFPKRASFLGIIPAYAGNTGVQSGSAALGRDHPRVCGEHTLLLLGAGPGVGSSPRMRGTRTAVTSPCPTSRIIPAYAGNTASDCCHIGAPRDHPRVCGEHTLISHDIPTYAGSSPRMRGTRYKGGKCRSYVGIIPAYAGNTAAGSIGLSGARDHPRVCGEHYTRHAVCI